MPLRLKGTSLQVVKKIKKNEISKLGTEMIICRMRSSLAHTHTQYEFNLAALYA